MSTLHPTLQEHLQAEIRRAQAQSLRQAAADLINRADLLEGRIDRLDVIA